MAVIKILNFAALILSTVALPHLHSTCTSFQLPEHCGCEATANELPSITCDDITPADFATVLDSVKNRTIKSLEITHCDPSITDLQPLPAFTAQNIVIEDCGFETIADNAFANVAQLESLSLYINLIRALPLFGPLKDLKYLTLADNKIERLDQKDFVASSGAQNTFDGLTNLKELYISHNSITDITDTAFKSLNSLTDIKIDHNPLKTLSPLAFASQELRELILGLDVENSVLANVPDYAKYFVNKYYINGTYYDINEDGTPIRH
uniref:Oplophorus-luciferin 2-monooxygenase non-catalytic subunit n=1 Tax=Panagrellus redivivus TaxID=6233 RepID=A0A7E4WDK3_PANRE